MVRDDMRKRVIHKLLDQQLDKYGNRTFLYFKESEFGYEDIHQRANQIACGLQRLGIKKGDKIAIVSENRPEWCEAYLAIVLSGGIAVPIDAQL